MFHTVDPYGRANTHASGAPGMPLLLLTLTTSLYWGRGLTRSVHILFGIDIRKSNYSPSGLGPCLS